MVRLRIKRRLTTIFIVNGVDVHVEAAAGYTLKYSRNIALEDSNNTGRPFDEWEIHNDAGQSLNPNKSLVDNNLVDGSRVFLNLKVGAGGIGGLAYA